VVLTQKQPELRTPGSFLSEGRDMGAGAINVRQLREERFDGREYEERERTREEDIGTNDLEFDQINDEEDQARNPLLVRKRRREPKRSLDSDERNVIFKKRKRNIMNEHQIRTIEDALKTEPEMQRYPKLIQQWTNDLNQIVSLLQALCRSEAIFCFNG
jgi:hypothetical protein